jgi:hypothetical protein
VALLQYHTCPVISTQTLNPRFDHGNGDGGITTSSYVAFTAGTSGECAVWDLSSCVDSYLAFDKEHHPHLRQEQQEQAENGFHHEKQTMKWETCELRPISVISEIHQSGINGMSAAQVYNGGPAGGGAGGAAALYAEVMVVTVGDDQSLTASLVTITQSTLEKLIIPDVENFSLSSMSEAAAAPSPPLSPLQCTLIAQVKEPNAHSSAARDVWTDGKLAFSTGLDQKVRRWEIDRFYTENCSGSGSGGGAHDTNVLKINETGCVVTQVLEPLTLDVAVVGDRTKDSDIGNSTAASVVKMKVAVAGRGLQVIEW